MDQSLPYEISIYAPSAYNAVTDIAPRADAKFIIIENLLKDAV
jgi:hypothetical protein